MMVILAAAAGVFLLFSLTIFVHELGHYLTARRLGLKIEVFSIGMGPALLRWKRGAITYRLGIIPFGGYVALPQMEPWAAEDSSGERPEPAAWWKKLLVALSGSAGNFIFAFAIATVIWLVGKPAAPSEYSSTVGYVEENSPAWKAGIRPGDSIIAVNGEQVSNWEEFLMLSSLHQEVELTVQSTGGVTTVRLPTQASALGMRVVGGLAPMDYCKVLAVSAGSSAEKAGALPGDLIVEFNGCRVFSILHLIDLVDAARGQEVPMVVRRDSRRIEMRVTPRYDPRLKRALIGVQFNTYYVASEERVHPPPWTQIRRHLMPVIRVVRALLTPSEARQAAAGIGGPFLILWSLWVIIQESFVMALWFTGFLNVNLAVLNLLPIPILDGSHVVYALYEGVTRRPVNRTVAETLTYAFYVLLIWVFLTISVRDIRRIFRPRVEAPVSGSATGQVDNPIPAR